MQVLQLLLSGVAQGCIYGLIALGFVLIYKATETVSFAQGDLMMLGAFTAFAGMTIFGLPFWLAAVLAVVAMAAFGMLVELKKMGVAEVLLQDTPPQHIVDTLKKLVEARGPR